VKIHYNRIAGESVERVEALSDGIFAVAMTLLVLDLHVPTGFARHGEEQLWSALREMLPQVVSYLMSFLTLGIFWNGQQTQLNRFARTDRHLSWIQLAFLFFVTLLPFSTRLLAGFIEYRTALLLYWGNIFLLGAVLLASWRYASAAKLVRDDLPEGIGRAIERRIVVSQSLYAFGALLCVFDTWASIGWIVLVQLNFALAPRLGLLSRF
jgi:uncharacterized membrane protein